jgi:RNA polymerase sigma-54 factor
MRMSQQMKLAPRMIQSMEILQMAALALEERIEQELASNPTLELREQPEDMAGAMELVKEERREAKEGEREMVVDDNGQDNNNSNADDFERLSNLSEEYGDSWESNTYETSTYTPARRETGERDGKMDAMANTAARSQSLADQLLDQWRMVETPPGVRLAGEYLIGFIDDDGYIRTPMEDIRSQAPRDVAVELIEDALERLQETLEPVGLGARDVRECLLLQIQSQVIHPGTDEEQILMLQYDLVSNHLKDIEANRLPKIAKALDVDIEDVKTAISSLKQYHIHPGRMLVDSTSQIIQPDAVIEYDEQHDRYYAMLTHGRVPSLSISREYEKMASDKTAEKKTREFVGNNLRSARWLIEAIEQRNNTLMRVINVVIEAQRDFFDIGPQALKPLPMTLVADQLGIHVATVSRAVNEKHLQTPRGIFPLRMFFSGGTETEDGDAMSWTAIQAKLQEIIDEEDKANPLNDDELVDKLKEKGIEIARRTVAKYRKQLNILPARQRKEY